MQPWEVWKGRICLCGGGREKGENSTRVNKTNRPGSTKGAPPGLQEMALTPSKTKQSIHPQPTLYIHTHSQTRQVGTVNSFSSSSLQIHTPHRHPFSPCLTPPPCLGPPSTTTLSDQHRDKKGKKTPVHFSVPTDPYPKPQVMWSFRPWSSTLSSTPGYLVSKSYVIIKKEENQHTEERKSNSPACLPKPAQMPRRHQEPTAQTQHPKKPPFPPQTSVALRLLTFGASSPPPPPLPTTGIVLPSFLPFPLLTLS